MTKQHQYVCSIFITILCLLLASAATVEGFQQAQWKSVRVQSSTRLDLDSAFSVRESSSRSSGRLPLVINHHPASTSSSTSSSAFNGYSVEAWTNRLVVPPPTTPFSPPNRSSSPDAFQIRPIFLRSPTVARVTRADRSKPSTSETSSSRNASTRAQEALQTVIQTIVSSHVYRTAAIQTKRASRSVSLQVSAASQQALSLVLKTWWTVPTFLALIPLYTMFVLQTGDAVMPHWWPVTKMDHIWATGSGGKAVAVVGGFLLSNIAYFLAGAYLLKRFPWESSQQQQQVQGKEPSDNETAHFQSWPSWLSLNISFPSRQTWFALAMFGSGLISTIFHTEQAIGSYAVANSLCYLDHAIAGTSTFYWFHACGKPSKRVLVLGLLGLFALSAPLPGYAFLHSAWHFLSAGAAVLWAVESHGEHAALKSTSTNEVSIPKEAVQSIEE